MESNQKGERDESDSRGSRCHREKKDRTIAGGGPEPADPAREMPGIEPAPPTLEAQNLDHWTARKVPEEEVFNRKFQEIFMSGKTFAS